MSTDQSHTFMYVDSDVPAGMTLSAWRTRKERAARKPRRGFGLRLVGLHPAG
jgi:hypothetical protein